MDRQKDKVPQNDRNGIKEQMEGERRRREDDEIRGVW